MFNVLERPRSDLAASRLTIQWQSVRWVGAPLGLALATRVIAWIVAYVGLILMPPNAAVTAPRLYPWSISVNGWLRWDALDYVGIARGGYWLDPIGGQVSPLVLPVYPAVTAFIGNLFQNPNLAAVVVSNVAFILAAIPQYWIAREKTDPGTAGRTILYLGICPFAFLFSAAYPQSLVLLWAALAMVSAERRRFVLAAVFGALAALTQPVGIVVCLAILVFRFAGPRAADRVNPSAADALLIVIPVAAVGVFLAYLHVEIGLAGASIVPGILQTMRDGSDNPAAGIQTVQWLNLLFGLLVLSTTPRVWRVLGPAYGVYQIGVIGLVALTNPFDVGAAAVLAFPGFLAAAADIAGELGPGLLVAISGLPFALLTVAFVNWYSVGGAMERPPDLSDTQRVLTTFHVAVARQRGFNQQFPSDVLLTVDNSLLVLAKDPLAPTYAPGSTITARLYVFVLRSSGTGYLVSARLHDQTGKEWARGERTVWNSGLNVLDPRAPPTLVAGNYLQEDLAIPVGETVPPGIYSLDIQIFQIPSFALVPVVPADGSRANSLSFSDVVVADARDLAPAGRLVPTRPLAVRLADGLDFVGSDVTLAGGTRRDVSVALYWAVTARPTHDYTAFVQVLDSSGKIITQSDSYPGNGRFPTTKLPVGGTFRDVHTLVVPPAVAAGTYEVIAGMYQLATLQRLPVSLSGSTRMADHLDLGTIQLPGAP